MGLTLHQDNMEEKVDLVIVGGGPTGLLSAVLARHMGLTVSVIDAKPGPLELGRADALNARTQQYLTAVGVLDELKPHGITCNTSSTFADGEFKSRQSKWWDSLEHCLHKNFLMIGQPVVESVLFARLDPKVVHYSDSVAAISEDDDGVKVTTVNGRVVHATYAIAADGAKSTVRNALDIPFTGTKPEMLWAVLDTFIDTDFPTCHEIITFEHKGQSRVAWIPRERGMARFYVLLEGEVTQEKAEASIREHMAPHRISFEKTEWFSTFDVKERIASTFVSKDGQGRIILAGDAAHVHSVNGGQGLNTGIADAFALAWRVSLAVKNNRMAPEAASKLIKSYDTERRTTAQGVIDVAAKLVRDTVKTAKEYVATIERNAGFITGMGVSYEGMGSELIQEGENGIWKAGKRCPDICVGERRLYSMVDYGKYLILSVGGGDTGFEFSDVATKFSLYPKTSGEESTSDVVEEGQRFVVVVRPDMYIGHVGEGWAEYMTRVFV